ncbi:transposase [Streptomyces sp. SID5477]|nr:transposase [Streptomyces sp. SID5477]
MTDDLVPDDLWERVEPSLPAPPARRQRSPGRVRTPDRVALAGIVYVLCKGVTWRDQQAVLPDEVVSLGTGAGHQLLGQLAVEFG